MFNRGIIMQNKTSKILRTNSLSGLASSKTITINNLREWQISGENLSREQIKALEIFDTYANDLLDNATSDADFQKKYMEITSLSNLTPYEEFLKDKYHLK